MTRLLAAAALAAAALVGTPSASADCELTRCCLPGDVCYEIQTCYCPYDGCWCLPVVGD